MALHNGVMSDVTRILSQIESGDPAAAEQFLPLVYDELRKLAAGKLSHEKPGQTLQATALVHEAYLRLVGSGGDRKRRKGDTKARPVLGFRSPPLVTSNRFPRNVANRLRISGGSDAEIFAAKGHFRSR